jgi:hypothetical protein
MFERSEALKHSDTPPHSLVEFKHTETPERLIELCDELHHCDKRAEVEKIKWGKYAAVSFLLAFVSMFALPPLLAFIPIAPVLLPPIAVITGIVFLVRRGRAAANDIDDRKLDVVRHVMMALGPEMRKKRKVLSHIDFRGYPNSPPQEDNTKWYNSTGQKTYERKWLRLSFVLLDGTQIQVQAVTKCKRKQKAKRKYTKIKDKVVDELLVTLKPAKQRTLDIAAQRRAAQRLSDRGGLSLVTMQVKKKQARFHFRTAAAIRFRGRGGWNANGLTGLLDGPRVLGAIVSSYRTVVSSR